MTSEHGTQPKNSPNKKPSETDNNYERKRGVKPNLPPRDGSTRTEGVTEKHRKQDASKNSDQKGEYKTKDLSGLDLQD
jgi:hypothetical protein